MLYIDVDAFCKLAHWNILPLLPCLVGYQKRDMATVASLTHRAKTSTIKPDKKLFQSAQVASLVYEFAQTIGRPSAPDQGILTALGGEPQIDPGEAVLLATTASDSQGRFLTGDKRALRALSKLDCAPLFAGRVLIVEQILSQCLSLKGRDWLLRNVCPYKNIDKAVSMILGSECDSSLLNIEDGIFSYVKEIASLHNPNLLFGSLREVKNAATA